MRLLLLVSFSIILWLQYVTAQNYCDPGLCRTGRHIACNNPRRFQGCDGEVIPIPFHRWIILEMHNKLRDRIAGGQLPGFPTAVRMGTMVWDDELENIAAMNLYQCRMQHDQCRNTQAYRFSGQNLSILGSRSLSLERVMRQAIDQWANEYRNANRRDVERYQNTGSRMIGHFTAMVRESNTRIGCAIAQWSRPRPTTYFVCNYATTNLIGRPIYRFGPTGAQCRTGRNPILRNLCSAAEQFDHTRFE